MASPEFTSLTMNSFEQCREFGAYLSAADVERISGFTGIRQVPHDPLSFLGADLNFVQRDGEKLLSVGFSSSPHFKYYKTSAPEMCRAEVPGIGEEAFVSPDRLDCEPIQFVFRKGGHCVALNTAAMKRSGKARRQTILTPNQLIALGKIVASRLS